MKRSRIIFIIITTLIFSLILTRALSPRQIDDVSPSISCEQEYLEKSEILWVIPLKNNFSISENKTWCEEILSLNKTLGMHGIYHTYHEFDYFVNESELVEAKKIFENCFGYEPTLFKPPYLRLSKENKILLEKNNLTVKRFWNQNTHKVYHCENTGRFSNSFHDFF
jgi:predicted deacetylase